VNRQAAGGANKRALRAPIAADVVKEVNVCKPKAGAKLSLQSKDGAVGLIRNRDIEAGLAM
jgi:hypothetical protein